MFLFDYLNKDRKQEMNRKRWSIPIVLGLLTLLPGCTREGVKMSTEQPLRVEDQGKLYTAYNLWYEKPERMFAINYGRGSMIPAGTRVAAVRVHRSRKRPTITFSRVADGDGYTIFFRPQFFPGVTIEEFKDRLFTDKPIEEQTAGLTQSEISAIREGRLVEGMRREAVLITRGYPPSHYTPSLDENTWYYWENRFVKEAVRFDTDGRTLGRENVTDG